MKKTQSAISGAPRIKLNMSGPARSVLLPLDTVLGRRGGELSASALGDPNNWPLTQEETWHLDQYPQPGEAEFHIKVSLGVGQLNTCGIQGQRLLHEQYKPLQNRTLPDEHSDVDDIVENVPPRAKINEDFQRQGG
jgi:hypothetical protein